MGAGEMLQRDSKRQELAERVPAEMVLRRILGPGSRTFRAAILFRMPKWKEAQ